MLSAGTASLVAHKACCRPCSCPFLHYAAEVQELSDHPQLCCLPSGSHISIRYAKTGSKHAPHQADLRRPQILHQPAPQVSYCPSVRAVWSFLEWQACQVATYTGALTRPGRLMQSPLVSVQGLRQALLQLAHAQISTHLAKQACAERPCLHSWSAPGLPPASCLGALAG